MKEKQNEEKKSTAKTMHERRDVMSHIGSHLMISIANL